METNTDTNTNMPGPNIGHIDILARNFLNGLIDGDFNLEKFVNDISSFITLDINKLKMREMHLYKVGEFLRIPFYAWTITNHVQSTEEETFGSLLQQISVKNCHNEGEFTCSYHRESLITHLIFAMLKCMERLPSSMIPKQQIQFIIMALLHDVGKFGCTALMKFNERKVTGFTFHGEYGGGILIKLWHNGFSAFFNKDEWENLARTVSVHMCGYHETTTETVQAKFKHTLLRAEVSSVKNNLYWLSMADAEGGCPEPELHKDIPGYIAFRETFKNVISPAFDLKKFKTDEKLRGTIIMVCGMTGSGKSHTTASIRDYLTSKGVDPNAIVVIERDFITCNITSKRIGRGSCLTKPSGKEFYELYAEYKRLNLASVVNSKMMRLIDEGIRQGKVVIVETMAHLFAAADNIYPESAMHSFKIAIDVLRNEPLTENDAERLGVTLDKQVQIFGEVSSLNWLPKPSLPGQLGTGRLGMLASISSASSGVENIRKEPRYKTRPHFRHQISWELGQRNLNVLLSHVATSVEYTSDGSVDEDRANLTQLISHLYMTGKAENVTKFFRERAFMCSPPALMRGTIYEDSSFYIKYLEHCRIFGPEYSRQGRGSVHMKLPSGKITCIKNLLQRGVEYLTGLHVEHGITENENVKIGEEWNHLDTIQHSTMTKFIMGRDIIGWLSFKNDGSLCGINIYCKGTEIYDVMVSLIKNSTDPRDDFSKMILRESEKRNLPFLPVLCSQGTLTMTDKMLPFNVTSICCGMCNIPYDVLCNDASNGMTPLMAMETYAIDIFLQSLETFWNNAPLACQRETMCASFEAIVPRRRDAWGNAHPEFAISYEEAHYRFLGCMFMVGDTPGQYRAHFQLDELTNGTCWDRDQPMCWKIKHTKQVEAMVSSIDKILYGQMTEDDFLEKFKPFGTNASRTFDYEGFVFFTNIEDSDPIGLTRNSAYIDYDIDYGKVKTEGYYKGHKVHERNMDFLLSLPTSTGMIIPLAGAVQEFYPKLRTSLISASDKVQLVLAEAGKMNHAVSDTLPEGKVKESYKKQNSEVQAKMIINASTGWSAIAYEIYHNEFPSLLNDDETHQMLKKLVMFIAPWKDNYQEKITLMVDGKHTIIKELFGIVMRSHGVVLG